MRSLLYRKSIAAAATVLGLVSVSAAFAGGPTRPPVPHPAPAAIDPVVLASAQPDLTAVRDGCDCTTTCEEQRQGRGNRSGRGRLRVVAGTARCYGGGEVSCCFAGA
ncbi:MAG TPA: hypothetical protein VKV26_03820 [Dehalococcoidia bacterium]|nr:hypothetical protein [Dehalococcoidia bacterium]